MKSLLIASLLLASAASCGARAMNFCNSGSIQTNVEIVGTDPGSNHIIADCQVAPNVFVSYSSEGAPSSRTAPATMRVVGSKFGQDARLIVIGKESYDPSIEETTAINMLVQDNEFGPGAMLYIRGVFAPDTVISVNGNSFDFGYPLTSLFPNPPGRADYFSSAIYVHTLSLLANAALSITRNHIVGDHNMRNGTNGFVAINAINFGGDVYLYGDRAHIDVVNNDIDILCNATNSSGMAVGGTKTLYMFGPNTHFAVDGNRITSSGSSAVFRHPDVVVVGGGMTSFSDNIINASTQGMAALEGDFRPVVRLGLLNVGDRPVNTWVRNNTITVDGPLASLGLEGDVTCGEGCALYVVGNKLAATAGSPSIHFNQGVELRGNGALWISENALSRADGQDNTRSAIHFAKNLRLNGASTASIDGNVFDAKAPGLMVELSAAAQSAFNRQTDARLYACGNSFGGAAVSTLDEVKAVTSSQVGNAAAATDCIALTTTTATTSAGETNADTTVAGNSTATSSSASGAETTTGNAATTTALPPNATTTSFNNKGSVTSVVAALAASAAALVAAML